MHTNMKPFAPMLFADLPVRHNLACHRFQRCCAISASCVTRSVSSPFLLMDFEPICILLNLQKLKSITDTHGGGRGCCGRAPHRFARGRGRPAICSVWTLPHLPYPELLLRSLWQTRATSLYPPTSTRSHWSVLTYCARTSGPTRLTFRPTMCCASCGNLRARTWSSTCSGELAFMQMTLAFPHSGAAARVLDCCMHANM